MCPTFTDIHTKPSMRSKACVFIEMLALLQKTSPDSWFWFLLQIFQTLSDLWRGTKEKIREEEVEEEEKPLRKSFSLFFFSFSKTLDETLGPSTHKTSCPKKAHAVSYFFSCPSMFLTTSLQILHGEYHISHKIKSFYGLVWRELEIGLISSLIAPYP